MPTTPYLKGTLGNGAVLSIGALTGSTGTETFTPVGGIVDITGDGLKRSTITVTNLSSGGVVRKLDTLVDYQKITITVARSTEDAGQAAVTNACAQGGAWDFSIQFPVDKEAGQTTTGDVVKFSAIVTDAGGFNLETDKANVSKITLEIDGAWTVTEGS